MASVAIPTLVDLDRELCRRSLADFVREAWHVVEPGTPYVHGWHVDAIAEHLEAVTAGQITRLLINVPPGGPIATAIRFFYGQHQGARGFRASFHCCLISFSSPARRASGKRSRYSRRAWSGNRNTARASHCNL